MSKQIDWRGAVEQVRRTMTPKGRASSGYYSIEGIRLHERALRAGKRVELAVLSETFNVQQEPRVQALLYDLLLSGCRLVTVSDGVMANLTDGRDLGEIIGLIRIPGPLSLPEMLATLDKDPSPLLLVGADIKDPGNTGALIRTALASGAAAFVACGISDPFHPKALRTSMGSLFKLPILIFENTVEAITALHEHDIQTVGLAVDGAVDLIKAEFSEKGVAVLIGAESEGLSTEMREAVDCLVSIPMNDDVDSYSVNAAAAIVLFDLGQRRTRN